MGAEAAVRRREFLSRALDFGKMAFVGLAASRWLAYDTPAEACAANAGIRTGKRTIMLDKVTVSEFAECLGDSFRTRAESGGVMELELIEATGLGTTPAGARGPTANREPFSLVFRGPAEPVLPQRIHTLEHTTLGRFQLFLVPIGPDGKGMRYEAVFN